jgi:hypothetical protein
LSEPGFALQAPGIGLAARLPDQAFTQSPARALAIRPAGEERAICW